jgi:hypothetical protein
VADEGLLTETSYTFCETTFSVILSGAAFFAEDGGDSSLRSE